MKHRERADLDRHITGNYGEDSVPEDPPDLQDVIAELHDKLAEAREETKEVTEAGALRIGHMPSCPGTHGQPCAGSKDNERNRLCGTCDHDAVTRLVEAVGPLLGAVDEALGDTDIMDDTTRLFRCFRDTADALAALRKGE